MSALTPNEPHTMHLSTSVLVLSQSDLRDVEYLLYRTAATETDPKKAAAFGRVEAALHIITNHYGEEAIASDAIVGIQSDSVPPAPGFVATALELAEICDRAFAPSHAALERGSSSWVEGRQLREAVDAVHAAIAAAQVPA